MWTDTLIAAGAVGAIVSVDGEAEAAGLANLESGEPMRPDHRTRVGSIDKMFMATLAVDLFDDLDASVAHCPTGCRTGETYDRLCFRDRALGLPEDLLRVGLPYPRRAVGDVVYSNTNDTAIQLILERETGKPLGELVRTRVIEPYA